MYTNKSSDGTFQSFGFIAPDGAVNNKNEVLFPYYDKQTPVFAAILAVSINQMETFLEPGALTAAMTINLNVHSQVTPGAKLHLKLKEVAGSANRTVTLGTGFDEAAANITVTLSTTVFKTFVYNGDCFMPVS